MANELAVIESVISGSQIAMGNFERALAKESDLKKIRNWERQFAAAEESLRKCRDGEVITLKTQNMAGRARALCSWTGGKILKAMDKHKGGRPKKTSDSVSPVSLREQIGVKTISQAKQIAHRWQAVAEIKRDELDQMTDVEKMTAGGKEITQAGLIKRGKELKKTAERSEEAVECPASGHNIYTGKWQEHKAKLSSNSVHLIFTDPPYHDEFIPQYGELAEYAAEVLVDGGSLLCYCGHYAIPRICPLMCQHLTFWWVNACVHTGPTKKLPHKYVIVGWKPILWFVKGKTRFSREFASDIVMSSRDKEHHDWGQGEIEASYSVCM